MKKEVKIDVIEICPEPCGPHDHLQMGYKGRKMMITATTLDNVPGVMAYDCTLSWEEPDPVHQCDEMPDWTDIIHNGQCWNVWRREGLGREKQLLAVLHCPYCGEELP